MITAPLTMRYGERPVHEPCAWFVPNSDPRTWLADVVRSGMDQTTAQLLPLPSPIGGALLVGRPANSPPSGRVAFGCVASRLYLPVEATISPELSPDEWSSLLSDDYLYVWHPAGGLVAFESHDIHSVASLSTWQRTDDDRWDQAEPGVAFAPRLNSVQPVPSQSIEAFLEESQGDIGLQASDLSDLPRSPQEPTPGLLNEAARGGRAAFAKFVRSLTNMVPATSDTPTWIDGVQNWADRQLQNLQSGWNAARNKEVSRLIDMLQRDPDLGLKYALPMGGGAHRGLTNSGNSLVPRSTDFSLRGLGGGGAADFWQLPYEMQQRLTELYRQSANRELNLGRYRRAAYIFAELLGDYHAAAGALKAGKHFREAATLYINHLARPIEAAECLEEGGLWIEAVKQYEELKEFERAGDLLSRLEQADEAEVQYRRAVSKQRAADDLLGAARLLEKKLGSVDEAIDELRSGWPHSRQAIQCLKAYFQALGRTGRHDDARASIQSFVDQPTAECHRYDLVEIVCETATGYPDRIVQATAADCTRVLASRALPSSSKSQTRQLLTAVTRLVPEDLLLARDCRRYVGGVKPKPPRPSACGHAVLVKTIITAYPSSEWVAATATKETIYVALRDGDFLGLGRGSWESFEEETVGWRFGPSISAPVVLAACPGDERVLIDNGPDMTQPVGDGVFPATDVCPFVTQSTRFPYVNGRVLASAFSDAGRLLILHEEPSGIVLTTLTPDFTPLRSVAVSSYYPQDDPTPMTVCGGTLYLASDNELQAFGKDDIEHTIDFERPITSLAASPANSRQRLAVGFDRGGVVLWMNSMDDGHSESFAQDIDAPKLCINRGGYLIAAGQGVCEVYSTRERTLTLEAVITNSDIDPIAVLSSPSADRFGIATRTNGLLVYEIR